MTSITKFKSGRKLRKSRYFHYSERLKVVFGLDAVEAATLLSKMLSLCVILVNIFIIRELGLSIF